PRHSRACARRRRAPVAPKIRGRASRAPNAPAARLACRDKARAARAHGSGWCRRAYARSARRARRAAPGAAARRRRRGPCGKAPALHSWRRQLLSWTTTWATPSDRSSLLHFRRALLEEGLETRLGLRVGLRDGGGQCLHGVAGCRIAL